MPSNFGDLNQFAYLYDALTHKYPGLTGDPGGTSVFQFATTPQSAAWTTGSDSEAYSVANAVPLNLGGFYAPGDALDAAYQDLITSIQPANYRSNAAYIQTQSILSGLQGSLQQVSQEANSAYYTWAADNTGPNGTPAESKASWLLDPLGGAGWSAKLQSLQGQIAGEAAKLAAIVASMDGALARAQKAATTDTMPISSGGPAIQVPRISISGDLQGDLARWAAYGDGQYDFDVTIDQSTVIKFPWKTVYSAKTSVNCWGASTKVNVSTSRIIEDVNYKLRVKIVGLNTYKITRGAWYDPDYVNPEVHIAAGATVDNNTFFGLNGSLHLIPETLFVMYRPTFELTISTETYKQQFETNADADVQWVDLFGARFNIDGVASLKPVHNGNNTTTLTFASPTTAAPQILGVVSKVAYNGSTAAAARRPVRAAAPLGRPAIAQVTVGILPQQHLNFDATSEGQVIQVRRQHPLGPTPFVVYDTSTRLTLGAGSCPALNAHPNYVAVNIPANVAFTVQNLSPNVSIDVDYQDNG